MAGVTDSEIFLVKMKTFILQLCVLLIIFYLVKDEMVKLVKKVGL